MPALTADQILLRDNARRLFQSRDGFALLRRQSASWPEVDTTFWREIATMGWLGLLLDEPSGGLSGSALDLVALLEGIGDLLPPEPVLPVMATLPLLAVCDTRQAAHLLDAALHGEHVVFAATEAAPPLMRSATHGVTDAHWADTIVFGLHSDGGFILRAVDRRENRDICPIHRTIDGGSACFPLIGPSDGIEIGAGEPVRHAFTACRNLQRLGAAASLVGLMQATFHKTVEYLKLRRQFGAAIGSFQALQHRAASLHIACNATRAFVYEAASAIGTANEQRACAAAKAKASDTAIDVVKAAVQMHGAIGFSDESEIALFFRRAMALAAAYGAADICRRDVLADGPDLDVPARTAVLAG